MNDRRVIFQELFDLRARAFRRAVAIRPGKAYRLYAATVGSTAWDATVSFPVYGRSGGDVSAAALATLTSAAPADLLDATEIAGYEELEIRSTPVADSQAGAVVRVTVTEEVEID